LEGMVCERLRGLFVVPGGMLKTQKDTEPYSPICDSIVVDGNHAVAASGERWRTADVVS
jgi:hypothetical protein